MNDRAKRLYEIRVGLRQALESFEILKIERLGKSLIDTVMEVDNGGIIGTPELRTISEHHSPDTTEHQRANSDRNKVTTLLRGR